MRINIGNNNTINKSIISNNSNDNTKQEKTAFYRRHPIISAIFIAVTAGIILMFSIWNQIVKFIEGVVGR